jgi:hypothetical protein
VLGLCQINHRLDVIATVVQQIVIVGIVLGVLFACAHSISHCFAIATGRVSLLIKVKTSFMLFPAADFPSARNRLLYLTATRRISMKELGKEKD